MSEKNDGGPAFPTREEATIREGDKWTLRHEGMTLRDWFAGMALQSLIADSSLVDLAEGMVATGQKGTVRECMAEKAYAFSDAMLAERDK